jgi:aspartyl protease family protein
MFGKFNNLHCRAACLLLLSTTTFAACAAELNVTGLFSNKAMVSIDGGKPRIMAAGESKGGVKLISANSNGATFEIDGKRQTLGMGQSISSSFAGGEKPVLKLTADSNGHFSTLGSINGYTTRFLVDTGATTVALSTSEAKRMGIDYQNGERGASSTANGVVPVYKVMLHNVKVGDISLNMVEAAVIEGAGLPVVLLGMTFLTRVEMHRENSVLTLTKQY